jgi:hypothetical protein
MAFSRAALGALALVPIAWVVIRVARHTVQVPVHDQWPVQVPVAIRAASGTLRPGDLVLSPYPEHRYLFTHALTALNTWLFGWDLRVDAFVNVGLALVVLGLAIALLRRQRIDGLALATVPLSALVFSARQRWTWGLMSSFLGAVLPLVLALWLLTGRAPSWWRLLAASGLAALATWNVGPGVVLWPALALAAWLAGYRRPAHLLFGIVAFVVSMAVFLVGHARPVVTAGSAVELASYTLAFLGGPLVPEDARFIPLATALGALGLGVVVASVGTLTDEGGGLEPTAAWLGLCAFSLGTAALAALARAPLLDTVPLQPLRARYVTLSTPFWVGVVGLVILAVTTTRRRRALVVSAWALLAALAPFYLLANVTAARAPVLPTSAHERCLQAFPTTRDATCLADVVYSPRAIQTRIDTLAALGLAAFRKLSP